MTKAYKIKTIDDILSIPADRQEVFFSELQPHIKNLSVQRLEIIDLLTKENGMSREDAIETAKEIVTLGSMTWNDDGVDEISEIVVRVKEKEEDKKCTQSSKK